MWKLRPTRPRATRETRTSAISRYVFITSAEPYSSTNWRFALSSVLGFRSATVAFIAASLSRRSGQLSSRQAIHSAPAHEAQEDGDADARM